ncbi:MAG TPA: hypothetical protein VGL11_08930 [Candidatus Binatia bacterium]|jgi:hypothetical protein
MRDAKFATTVGTAILFALGASAALSAPAPEDFSKMSVISLAAGPNEVDLDGDGRNELIFLTRREGVDNRKYNQISFFRATDKADAKWQLITLYDSKGAFVADNVRSSEAPDCVLRDFRVLRSSAEKNAPVVIIIGEREFGQGFADTTPVRFVVYRLDKKVAAGMTTIVLREDRVIQGKEKYCDMEKAFLSELGVGPAKPVTDTKK